MKLFLYFHCSDILLPLCRPRNNCNANCTIIVNAQELGLTNNLNNYPLLVRLNTTNFPDITNRTRPGGTDIRFAKTDGTYLSYEIEDWVNGSSGTVWVQVESISTGTETSLVMYYDNPAAFGNSDPASVFNTTHGFVGKVAQSIDRSTVCRIPPLR